MSGAENNDASADNLSLVLKAVDAGGTYDVNEGSSVVLGGSTPGVSGTLAYAWDLDNNGSFETSGRSPTFSASGLDGSGHSQLIRFRVTDSRGVNYLDAAVVRIRNVSPTINSVNNSGPISVGGTATVVVSASDPAGTLAPLTYEFDLDDNGTFEVGPQSSNQASRVFTASGRYRVSVRVTDGDGGIQLGFTFITVGVNRLPATAALGVGGVLTVTGTSDADNIVVSQTASGAIRVRDVTANVLVWSSNDIISRIIVNGLEGNDSLDARGDARDGAIINRSVTLYGGDGADTLYGGKGGDSLNGDGSNDSIYGGDGNDFLNGGAGNDYLDGGAGTDTMFASIPSTRYLTDRALNDGVSVQNTHDRIELAVLTGDDSANLIDASGFSGSVTISGGLGQDTLIGGKGSDLLEGGDDHDSLRGGAGNDRLWGGDGNDRMDGGAGNDYLDGGTGTDTLVASIPSTRYLTDDALNDGRPGIIQNTHTSIEKAVLTGDDSSNKIDASKFSGPVTLNGGKGNDTLIGGKGNDLLWGGSGNDKLQGNGGDDNLVDGSGNDTLYGGADNDVGDVHPNDSIMFDNGSGGTTVVLAGQVYLDNQGSFSLSQDPSSENTAYDELRVIPPEVVTGAWLTDFNPLQVAVKGPGDTKAMSFNDIDQQASPVCAFAASLSAVARTSFNLAASIKYVGLDGDGNCSYSVRLFDKVNSSYVARWTTVVFNGRTTTADLNTADNGELWATLFLRAYNVRYSNNSGYSMPSFALSAITGRPTSSVSLSASTSIGNLKNDLAAGKAVTALSRDASTTVLDTATGIISDHAYTVVRVYVPTVVQPDGGGYLIELRNPWGHDTQGDALDGKEDSLVTITNKQFVRLFEIYTGVSV